MMAFLRPLLAAFAVLSIPLLLQAQDPCTAAQAAPQPDYKLTMQTGAIVPESDTAKFSYTLKNDSNVLIRLENINPYAFKCSASTSTTDFKETAIAGFLGNLSAVANVSASGPAVSTAPPPAPVAALTAGVTVTLPDGTTTTIRDSCQQRYLLSPAHQKVQALWQNQDPINQALAAATQAQKDAINAFNANVKDLVSPPSEPKVCEATVKKAKAVVSDSKSSFDITTPDRFKSGATLPPLDQVINNMANDAQLLIPHLADDMPECKAAARQFIDEDSKFLFALVVGANGAPSTVDTWRSQIKNLNTVRANIDNGKKSVAEVLSKWQNFFVDTAIHGNQQVVTYTATCTQILTKDIAAPDSTRSSSTAPPDAPTAPGDKTAAPTVSTWKHDFKFGPGPRFVLAGGLVVSPLRQITFNTTATPGGSGTTANTIIQQQNSSTRILPIAMLHGRFWDQLPAKDFQGWRWVPNYLSVGVTAKSSGTQGTNIEYLFGPSWAFADRQLFITAGAYAGQQQRLANSLTVGSTTSLSGANLPITQTTIWKAGFAITWAPGGK
ncbi:MAG TPA: hypothetical protein VI488_01560 [Candidatus Angelobacter sp.]